MLQGHFMEFPPNTSWMVPRRFAFGFAFVSLFRVLTLVKNFCVCCDLTLPDLESTVFHAEGVQFQKLQGTGELLAVADREPKSRNSA